MVPKGIAPTGSPMSDPTKLETERADPRYENLDAWPTANAVTAMLEAQMAAAAAVHPATSAIAAAIDAAAARLGQIGRLVYVGAGTSGRIAVQDGAELQPTFNWPIDRVVFAIFGGSEALLRSIEGAEDNTAAAEFLMAETHLTRQDVVIGVAASGTTPYTIAAIKAARAAGALTIAIANNPGAPLLAAAEHPILAATGPEVVAGSTRMKAGTAQKIVLNLLSTGIMIRLGRVYRGRMVDMAARNAKLTTRAKHMVMDLAGCDAAQARAALAACNGHLKPAILVARGMTPRAAEEALTKASGHLREIIEK
jgi:N-acetylmuramic acid 6-phosphate etherase